MQGFYYAIFVISILVIIRWYVRNERSSPDGSTGVFAMRQPQSNKKFSATPEPRRDGDQARIAQAPDASGTRP